jgi:hypothetical protein
VVVEAHDGAPRPTGGAQKRRQQRLLGGRRIGDEALVDVPARFEQQRQHQPARFRRQTREIQDAFEDAGDRMGERHADTGELLEPFDEVFGAFHRDRAALLDDGAQAVRAGALLVVADAGQRADAVEVLRQRAHAEAAVDDARLGVGEDDACARVVELEREAVEHLLRGAHQPALAIEIVERQLEWNARRHAAQLTPLPGLGDLRSHQIRLVAVPLLR